MAETLLVIGLTGLIIWLQEAQVVWLLASGLAIGGAALTRPAYQLLAVGLVVTLLGVRILLGRHALDWRRTVLASGVLIFTSGALVGGKRHSNYRFFGYFGITPKFGLTLCTKTARSVERLPDEYGGKRSALFSFVNAMPNC